MKEALKLALEALESGVKTTANRISWTEYDCELMEQAITAIKEALTQPNQFNPDWDAMAVMVEEMQRMAKRIEDLEAMLELQTARIVDLQTHIENLEGEG